MTKKERLDLINKLKIIRKNMGKPIYYYTGALIFDSFNSDGISFENEEQIKRAFKGLDDIIEELKKGLKNK